MAVGGRTDLTTIGRQYIGQRAIGQLDQWFTANWSTPEQSTTIGIRPITMAKHYFAAKFSDHRHIYKL